MSLHIDPVTRQGIVIGTHTIATVAAIVDAKPPCGLFVEVVPGAWAAAGRILHAATTVKLRICGEAVHVSQADHWWVAGVFGEEGDVVDVDHRAEETLDSSCQQVLENQRPTLYPDIPSQGRG